MTRVHWMCDDLCSWRQLIVVIIVIVDDLYGWTLAITLVLLLDRSETEVGGQRGERVRGGPHRPDSDPVTGAGGARGAGAVPELCNTDGGRHDDGLVTGVIPGTWSVFYWSQTGHWTQGKG